MARILSYLDAPMWRAVRELYLRDKVEEALEEAEKLGGDDTNDLYAEAEVRKNGTQWKVRPWLTVEAIESEIGHALSDVLEIVGTECESLADKFGWNRSESTLVSLLPHDVEAPWMPGRWGYFVDKVPYDKICLPFHLIFNLPELTRTIQHEFMHDITTNLSNGHIPRWLSEALSTLAENRLDLGAAEDFQKGGAEWLTPVKLDAIVSHDNRDREAQRAISRGYAQANFVARYMVTLGGEVMVGQMLRKIGDESVILNLETQLLMRTRTDTAIRSVYHMTEAELFEKAKEWVLATRWGRTQA